MNLINIVLLWIKLNSGLQGDTKAIMKEGMDVINSLSIAFKDGKITNAEKKALVKELREFTKVAIKVIDDILPQGMFRN